VIITGKPRLQLHALGPKGTEVQHIFSTLKKRGYHPLSIFKSIDISRSHSGGKLNLLSFLKRAFDPSREGFEA
jgi:hypothetical protein